MAGTRRSTTGGQRKFATVPSVAVPRSVIDRNFGHKTTFNAGMLIPIMVDEALPGDTLSLRMASFGRLATPIYPVFENMYLDYFFFAVPIRILWDNFVKMMGEQENPGDSIEYQIPHTTPDAGGWSEESLADYMGVPTKVEGAVVSSIFFRAYNLIWNEWFRHQDLQDSVSVPKGDGPDDPNLFNILPRGKRHDYFTSCLPWPQKGAAVTLPLTGNAPVEGTGMSPTVSYVGGGGTPREMVITDGGAGVDNVNINHVGSGGANQSFTWATTGMQANLTNVTAATINELREAFQLQRMLEKDARGGTRYTEVLRSHFGVISPDQRLQRPEYLGGFTHTINVNPVAQTSETTGNSPQANVSGYGTTGGQNRGFTKSFTEHSVIIGLVCMRADLNYQQGLHKMFSRKKRYEFYWPSLAHLGEQEVTNQEIFLGDNDPENLDVFGYQERWAEYRYKPSMVTGRFRSNSVASLDAWHLAQDFAARPVLNANFIVEKPPVERIIAVPTEPHMLLDMFFQYRCARPMPVRSVPGLIDHF